MQGKHRSDRLALDLEDVNNKLSELGSIPFSTVAAERHYRAELVEEQLEVRTALREHKAHMQAGP